VAADALAAAFRIPNFLQNLFGEGALSASFIPEYAKLRAQGREAEANQLAGAVAGLLGAVVTTAVAVGVLATPPIVDLLVPGFEPPRRELTIRLVRIMFPGVGILVLSAWCLAILNSHRRFLLPYAAPVGWNGAIIAATLVGASQAPASEVVVWTAAGATAGGLIQLLLQLPLAWRLTGGVRLSFGRRLASVRAVVVNFGPAALTRGVVQISAFIDGFIASWLPLGAVAVLGNAQLLYTLPVSLFGVSIAAAELPELAAVAGSDRVDDRAGAIRDRLATAARQIGYWIVPSTVAFLALGHIVTAVVLRSGAFTAADAAWVWGTLAGSTVGLLAATLGRLYASVLFALGDTRTPFRFALIRVTFGVGLGILGALYLPGRLGLDAKWGTAGLALGSGIAGWVEFVLLRRAVTARIGSVATDWWHLARLWLAAGAGAGAAWAGQTLLPGGMIWWIAVLAVYGLTYLLATVWLGVPMVGTLRPRFGRR
jgi:putative peptidoglycan lipid II flippase